MMSRKEMDKMMEELREEDRCWKKEIRQYNKRVLNAIKNQLGEQYYFDVIQCLEDSECHGKLEIVKTPPIEPQETEWESFNHVVVDQYMNGGMSGDEFVGYLYIPLKRGKYLKSHYSM